MDNVLPKNKFIGETTAETLEKLSAVVMLLRYLDLRASLDEEAEYGLLIIHQLIQDTLEYEIKRVNG